MKVFSFTLLFVSMAFSFPPVVFGQWEDAIYRHMDDYPIKLDDGFASSVFGRCLELKEFFVPNPYKYHDYTFDSTYLKSKKIKIRVMYRRGWDERIKKSKLALILPGAFSNISDQGPKSIARVLAHEGYHTVIFPNPWGQDFIRSGTARPSGDILYESKAIWEAMKKTYSKMQYFTEGEVRLVGVSYGSFLAAMLSAYNAQEGFPIPLKDTTILSPPMRMGETLHRLDSFITDNQEFNNIGIGKTVQFFANVCRYSTFRGLKKDVLQESKVLAVTVGFHRELSKSAVILDKALGYNTIPVNKNRSWQRPSADFAKWRAELNFSNFIDSFGPYIRNIVDSNYGDLSYWIALAELHGHENFRIIVAEDDFLNYPKTSFDVPEHTIIMKNGGHYGYRSSHWFKKFLKTAF